MSKASAVIEIGADHPAYAGHFPGMPILPGVVVLDEALHAVSACTGIDFGGELGSVKFLSPVRPGEALRVEFAVQGSEAVRFDVYAGERRVATGSARARRE